MTHVFGRHFLQIPGPSPVPDRVLRAMSAQVIDHRGPEFGELGLKALAGMIWGYGPRNLTVPFQGTVEVGGLVIATSRIVVIAGTIVICAGLYLFLSRTKLGVAMQAASQNQLAAPIPSFSRRHAENSVPRSNVID